MRKYPQADLNADGILTMKEAKVFKQKMQGNHGEQDSLDKKSATYAVAPTKTDVSYGPFERNILDFWQADASSPSPIVVYIHGGGFTSGDKSKAAKTKLIEQSLEKGYHFASINYRYAYKSMDEVSDKQKTGKPGCFLDGARAIQFLKHKAKEWNIDKERVIIVGSSAGGGICAFISMYDDLSDPNSPDPVLRESSRVFAMGHMYSQSTYDLTKWPEILGTSEVLMKKIAKPGKQGVPVHIKLGLKSEAELATEKGKEYSKMVDMVSYASSDDPPMFIFNNGADGTIKSHGHMVHHPRFSIHLADKANKNGIETKLVLPKIDGLGKIDQYTAFLEWVDTLL